VPGNRVTFLGDAMAAVVQGVKEVRALIGQPPVVVGGLAVMCRLAVPYRATTDLDIVDRLRGKIPPTSSTSGAGGLDQQERRNLRKEGSAARRLSYLRQAPPPEATASAASRAQPPAKTESRSSTLRSAGLSRL